MPDFLDDLAADISRRLALGKLNAKELFGNVPCGLPGCALCALAAEPPATTSVAMDAAKPGGDRTVVAVMLGDTVVAEIDLTPTVKYFTGSAEEWDAFVYFPGTLEEWNAAQPQGKPAPTPPGDLADDLKRPWRLHKPGEQPDETRGKRVDILLRDPEHVARCGYNTGDADNYAWNDQGSATVTAWRFADAKDEPAAGPAPVEPMEPVEHAWIANTGTKPDFGDLIDVKYRTGGLQPLDSRNPARYRWNLEGHGSRDWDIVEWRPAAGQPAYVPPAERLKPDADGWIAWAGGECPSFADDDLVEYRMRTGPLDRLTGEDALTLRWSHIGQSGDIVAYRVLPKPGAVSANGWPIKAESANLGLATTGELLRELAVRAEVGGYADYRTVGGDS